MYSRVELETQDTKVQTTGSLFLWNPHTAGKMVKIELDYLTGTRGFKEPMGGFVPRVRGAFLAPTAVRCHLPCNNPGTQVPPPFFWPHHLLGP